ncbi:hypothetical protein [Kibdelosporangium philippinense]|uniref:hypothetical protein n=1 Tax=Kibdelosporangium philippinense TaxID=211113 RepID=UPI003609BBF1
MPWLASVYNGLDAVWTIVAAAGPAVIYTLPVLLLVAAAFEGRDKTPGVGWLVHPDRDDADYGSTKG